MLLLQEKEQQQLELFNDDYYDVLPHRPYCSDTKGWLKILAKNLASQKRYIQHNEPSKIKWLVYDVDYWGALDHISQNHLPPPNFVAINPVNGNSHLFYGLSNAVCITEKARKKPIEFLRKISYVLGDLLEADKGYGNFISKNPLHKHWQVLELESQFYELNDFLDWFDIPKVLPKEYKRVGVGRNVTVFDAARHWAYRQVLAYRMSNSRQGFIDAVYNHCDEINQTFPTPLHESEIRCISKSISKWTWDKYTARWSDDEFSRIQAKRGVLGAVKTNTTKWAGNDEKRLVARSMASNGVSQTEIAKTLEVRQGTISKWLKT